MLVRSLCAVVLLSTLSLNAVFQEIEYKIQLSDNDQASLESWLANPDHAVCKGTVHQKDTYLLRPDHPWHTHKGFKDTDKVFRIREASNKHAFICYKYCHRDANGMPLYRDEYETSVKDAQVVFDFLEAFAGPFETTVVEKERTYYLVDDIFAISLDDINGIGRFVEIELTQEVNSIEEGYRLIEDFLKTRSIKNFVKITHSYVHMVWNPEKNFKINVEL